MAVLPLILSILGVVAWSRLLGGEGASWLRRLVEATATHLVASTIVAVGLVSVGAFRPVPAAALASALPVAGVGVLLARRPRSAPAVARRLATPVEAGTAALVLLFLPLAWPNLEPMRMVGDAGVYSTRAVHHLLEGGLTARLPIRDRLRGELLAIFDRDNLRQSSEAAADPRVGAYLPGTYVSAADRSRFSFQFLPGWPMTLALWAGHFGLPLLFGVQPWLYGLSIGLFALVAQEHARGIGPPLAAALLLASSPLLLFFSRYPTSELLLLFAFLFVLRFAGDRSWRGPVLGSAGVVLLALSHSSIFLYTPLLLVVALDAARSGDRWRLAFCALSFGSLLVLLPVSFASSPHYMMYVYSYAFAFLPVPDPMRTGLAVVGGFYLLGLVVSLASLRRGPPPGARRAGLRGGLPEATVASLVLMAVGTAWSGYRLGWTDLFLHSPTNVGAWARRSEYANGGFSSLVHLNIVSIVMATALVGLPIVVFLAVRRGRFLVAARFRAFLLVAVLLSLGIYTFLRGDVPFNYYASRYFLPVLVPSVMLLLAVLPRRLQPTPALAAIAVVAGLVFNLRYDVALLRERGSAHSPFRFLLELSRSLPPERVLFVHGGPFAHPTVAIPLGSLGRHPVIRVVSANGVPARDLLRRYCRELGLDHAFWLGPEPPKDGRPAKELRFVERESPEGILYPTALVVQEKPYYLSMVSGSACSPADPGNAAS